MIGVGGKNSTSDLLISSCDEFIFYDDFVADCHPGRCPGKDRAKGAKSERRGKTKQLSSLDDPSQQAVDLVVETAEALYAERGERAKLWASMIKQTLKRQRLGFTESHHGFSSFNDLPEEAQSCGQMTLESAERSDGYVARLASRE